MALFKRVNREAPEQIFIVVYNNEGSTLAADSTCQWEPASASVDGVKVRAMDTANEYCFAGIVDTAILAASYGLIQIYGYRSTSTVLTTNTSITTGVALVPVAGQVYLQSQHTVYTSDGNFTRTPIFAVLLESITTSTGNVSRKVFVRAMSLLLSLAMLSGGLVG